MLKKCFALLLGAAVFAASLAGCAQDGTPSSTIQDGTRQSGGAGDSSVVGQVTAVDGDKITLALGEFSMPGRSDNAEGSQGDGTQTPGTGQPSSQPEGKPAVPDGQQDEKQPSGDQKGQDNAPSGDRQGQNPPSGGQGGGMPSGGGMAGGFAASGEEKTVTVTDSTVITLAGREESSEGSLSDITVGSIVTVTLDGDAATAITVGGFGGGQGGRGPGRGDSDGSTAGDGASSTSSAPAS